MSNDLKVPRAFIDGRHYTVDEWSHTNNQELRTRVRKGEYELKCEIGCPIYFKKGSESRRAHFCHKSTVEPCALIEKYASSPGGVESEQHFKAKYDAGKLKKFGLCCARGDATCGNIVKRTSVDPEWKYVVEYRVGPYLVDGAFLDENNDVMLVVEVYETHLTNGPKRNWLVDNGIRFVEVCADDVSKVIDHWHKALVCKECDGIFWKRTRNAYEAFNYIMEKYDFDETFDNEDVTWMLKCNPNTSYLLRPGTVFSRVSTNKHLIKLIDRDGVTYNTVNWYPSVKYFNTHLKNEISLGDGVDIDKYIQYEKENAGFHREAHKDDDYYRENTAESRAHSLENLKKRGVKRIFETNVPGIVHVELGGKKMKISLRKSRVWRGGKWECF